MKAITTIKKRLYNGCIYLLLGLLILGVFAPIMTVFAETLDYNDFEQSNVVEDLKSIDGFEFGKYPKNPNGSLQLLNVVEYCYSESPNINKYYGLYLYCYNPTCYNVMSLGNSVQLAVEFNDDGSAKRYEKFSLEFLNSSGGDDKNLFLKFRVLDIKKLLSVFASDARRYEISGMEVYAKPEIGSARLVDYKVGGFWEYSGFGAGCGSDSEAESTLNCEIQETEVISLDIMKDSVYRTGENSNGKGHRTQVNSVAFAVPNRFLRDYGQLQRIDAEWYEFRTNPIVITSEEGIYNSVKAARDIPIYGTNEGVCPYGFLSSDVNSKPEFGTYWKYNATPPAYKTFFTIPNIFFSDCGDIANYTLSSETLAAHIRNYPIKGDNFHTIRSGKISSATITPVIDSEHSDAHRLVTIDASRDKFDLKAYTSGAPSGWHQFWKYYFGTRVDYPEVKDITPIYILDENSIKGDAAELSRSLFWSDVDWLKSFYGDSVSQDKSTVLFRFATSDYFSTVLKVYKNGLGYFGDGKGDKTEATGAIETVYLDFDIISLTFARDGIYRVIPTVSSPIDIIGAIEPPIKIDGVLSTVGSWFSELWAKIKAFLSENKWLMWVLIVLAVLIGLPLLVMILPYLIKFIVAICKLIWWIISLPFRLIYMAVSKVTARK